MKIAGLICEYNPFHYGHKYQLNMIKQEFDAVVCVMSGSFVQRGDAAVYDKWSRAKAALLNGADLVLELPVRFSLSSAQDFAKGAVEILDKTGVIDSLCFGSECTDIEKLIYTAEIMSNEPYAVSEKIRELMKNGISFPKARETAYQDILDTDIISRPNNILAVEYIAALKSIGSKITPSAFKRKAVGHHSSDTSGIYASATTLRKKLKNGEDINPFTPFDFSGHERYDTDRLSSIFRYKLIYNGVSAFEGIRDMEPGLAERFIKFADAGSLSDIIAAVKTKRYTQARLQRIALSAILGLKGGYRSPEYIRILGMTETGRKILSEMRTAASLPVINKAADFKDSSINEDILATNIAALCADRPILQNRDYTTSPIYLSRTY